MSAVSPPARSRRGLPGRPGSHQPTTHSTLKGERKVSTTISRERTTKQIGEQLRSISSEQAQTGVALFAPQMSYEAHTALEQLRAGQPASPEVLGPLERAVGWAEALAFVQQTQQQQQQVPVLPNGQSKARN